MSEHILVTGGAGFVGSHLCAALAARGEHPVAIDDLSNGAGANVPAGVPLITADLSDDAWRAAAAQYSFKAVLHLAAQSSNAVSFKDPARDVHVNQLATLNVLEFCRDRGVRRLLFTSSMSAYGQAGQLPTPESEACRPETYYGVHKLASEQYIRIFGAQHGVDWTIFRLYTTYGMGQNLANRDQGLIKIYLGYVLRGEPLFVRGAAGRRRDVVHVTDVVNAIVLALDNPRTHGRCYNVGTGRALTVRQIIDLILSEAEQPADYPVSFAAGDPGDPHSTLADVTALQQDTGWAPTVTAEDGIRRTVQAYLAARAARA